MKTIYTFGNGNAEGRADMKELLGGKGANLAEIYNRWRKTWLAYIFTFGQFEKIWENIRT